MLGAFHVNVSTTFWILYLDTKHTPTLVLASWYVKMHASKHLKFYDLIARTIPLLKSMDEMLGNFLYQQVFAATVHTLAEPSHRVNSMNQHF